MVVHAPDDTQEVVWLHADHLGRPVAATDADGGTLWRSALLTPFGDDARPWLAANDNGSASVATALAALDGLGSLTQHLRFPGQYADAETRGANGTELSALTTLSHNHNRTYDPMLGRYLTPDPIGLAGGLNRYAYVGGNPVKYTDSLGLFLDTTDVQRLSRGIATEARKPSRKTPWGRAYMAGFIIGATGRVIWDSATDRDCDDEEDDYCSERLAREESNCYRRFKNQGSWIGPCIARAKARYQACVSGNPDPAGEFKNHDIY